MHNVLTMITFNYTKFMLCSLWKCFNSPSHLFVYVSCRTNTELASDARLHITTMELSNKSLMSTVLFHKTPKNAADWFMAPTDMMMMMCHQS